MASSGTINGAAGYAGFKIRIKWSTNSQSVANTSSNVTVGVYLVVPTNYTTTSTMKGSYTVNGSTYNINIASTYYGGGEHLLKSGTYTIPHNTDGTKTFNMSADRAHLTLSLAHRSHRLIHGLITRRTLISAIPLLYI